MPEDIEEKPIVLISRPEVKSPDGFWSLPGGRSGMQGSTEGVMKAIDGLDNIPPHWKTAIKEAIQAEVSSGDFNWVVLHANAVRHETDGYRRSIGGFDIECSKKLL
jgi:hypothetical protein